MRRWRVDISGVERRLDLVVSGKEPLRLLWRFEAPQELFTLSSGSVCPFDPIVQPFVCSVIRTRHKIADRFEIASQLIRDRNTGFANCEISRF